MCETETRPTDGTANPAELDPSLTYYRLADIAEFKTETKCWLAIDNKVYDVTKFLEEHPGGDDVMKESSGKDATEDFDDVGHSTQARKMLEEYYVGELHPDDHRAPRKESEAAGGSGTLLFLLVPVMLPTLVDAERCRRLPA